MTFEKWPQALTTGLPLAMVTNMRNADQKIIFLLPVLAGFLKDPADGIVLQESSTLHLGEQIKC